MAIHGSLEEVPLPDVLQLLALGKKSGCLTLVEGAMRGHIYLDEGRVCDATVINRPDRLGDQLVKRGRITREQLDQAMARKERDAATVGRVLVDSGQVDRAEVETLVRTQVEEAVYFLFTWRHGDFTFTRDARPEPQGFLVSIDPEGLLLEGARRVDEWSVIQKKIPSFDLTFRLEKDPRSGGTHALTGEQQRLLPFLDGARDVTALVEASGLSEFEAGKALYGLITAGFAQMVERRARVRHLEQGQLLAYLVREGEFADPARRRQAANHIADCSTCATRLKTIHVRRTQETTVPVETTIEVTPVAATAVADPPVSVARAAGWGGTERRTGTDRRKGDQRKGDRRRVQVMTWLAFNPERRGGDERRALERRLEERRGHRGLLQPTDLRARAAAAAPRRSSGPRARRATPSRRPDLPRPTPPGATQPSAPPSPSPPLDPEKTVEVPSVPADGRAAATNAAPPAKVADLAWLVTPEQSLELIRASRGVMVPKVPGAPKIASPPPTAPPAPTSSPPPTPTPVTPAQRPAPAPAPARPAAVAPIRPAVAPAKRAAPAARPAERASPKRVRRRWVAGAASVVALAAGALAVRPLFRGQTMPPGLSLEVPAAPAPSVTEPDRAVSVPLSDSAIAGQAAPHEPIARPSGAESPPAARVTVAAPPPVTPVTEPRRPAAAAQPAPSPAPVPHPPTVDSAALGAAARAAPRDSQAAPPTAVQPPPVVTAAAPAAAPTPTPAAPPPTEVPVGPETDPALLAGTWVRTSRGEAEAELGHDIVAVPGLPIASIARPGTGGRSGIRIVQTLDSGQPLELVITRPAFLNRAGAATGPDRVTAVRVVGPAGPDGVASGSARLGGYLINARAGISADELKALLARLARPGQ